jgi:hypothetical protein
LKITTNAEKNSFSRIIVDSTEIAHCYPVPPA